MKLCQASSAPRFGLALGAALLLCGGQAFAAINYSFDRGVAYSGVHMGCSSSTGESLATNGCGPVNTPPEAQETSSPPGDIRATFTWTDGTSLSGIWQNPSGRNVPSSAVLYPNTGVPGVHFDVSQTTPFYRGFVEQSGDTFTNPWEIRNGSSAFGISQVVLEATGTPDMGFDTDDGNDPTHGFAGNLLTIVAGVSDYTGGLNVHYDWWNDWNGTTDMFHRMTITFTDTGGLLPTTSLVFIQDTDEVTGVPEPASLALLATGLGLLAAARRRRRAG